MGRFQKIKSVLKAVLISLLIWFGLTILFLVLDSALSVSEKLGWFPAVAILLPIFCAVLYAVLSLKPRGVQKRSSQAASAPAVQTPAAEPPKKKSVIERIDEMEGHEFEQFCAELLKDCGFQQVHVTKSSGDQGVDIIAIKHGLRYAFQCKRYSSKIGNAAVQQVNTGKMLYSCQKAVVITNSHFTSGAVKAAQAVGVELWDREVLEDKINRILSQNQR